MIDLEIPTYWIFIGESGSGKTMLTQEMFGRYFQRVFNQLVIVSDTFHTKTPGSWGEFYQENEMFNNKMVAVIDDLDEITKYRDAAKKIKKASADPKFLKSKYNNEEFNKARFYDPTILAQYSPSKRPPHTLWIFDDFLGSIKQNTKDAPPRSHRTYRAIINSMIDEMVINARHRAVSAFVLCQERTGIPPTARNNARVVTFFPTGIRQNLTSLSNFFDLVHDKGCMERILSEIGRAKEGILGHRKEDDTPDPTTTKTPRRKRRRKQKHDLHDEGPSESDPETEESSETHMKGIKRARSPSTREPKRQGDQRKYGSTKYKAIPKNFIMFCKYEEVFLIRMNWKTCIVHSEQVEALCRKMHGKKRGSRKNDAWEPYMWLTKAQKEYFDLYK